MNRSLRSLTEILRAVQNESSTQENNFISKFTLQLKKLEKQKSPDQYSGIQIKKFDNSKGQKFRIKKEKKKLKEQQMFKDICQQYRFEEEEEKQQSNQIEDEKERIQNLAQNLALVITKNQKQFTLQKERKKKQLNQSLHHNLKYEIQKQKADIYAQIIHKIAEYPTIESLREQSLVDQIYKILLKHQKKNTEKILSVKQQLDKLFIKGIKLNDLVFNQQRIKQAQKQNRITFHPTCLVSGQIFRQLILKKDFKFCISYGHKGIAKTFTYFFYQMLSNLFFKEIVQRKGKNISNLCKKLKIQTIPKLFYWNMNIDYNNSYMDIQKLFFEQCKEIPESKMKEIQRICKNQFNEKMHLFKFLKQICDFYKQLSIETYLIIDQINQIASVFREHYIMQKKGQLNQKIKKKHELAQNLNEKRIQITDPSIFNCVIYNSSINNEILFNQIDFSLKENKQLYQSVKKSIHLIPQQQHSQSQCYQFRILYPEIIKLQSTVWSIADMVMFELKKYIHLEQQNVIKKLRKKIFDQVALDQGKTIFSYLTIRQEIQLYKDKLLLSIQYEKLIQKIIQDIKIRQKQNLKMNYKNFQNKTLEKKQRLKAKAIILDSIIRKRTQKTNNQDSNKLLNKFLSQQATSIMMQLLQNRIQLNRKKNFVFQHLDRNLFISFKKQIELQSYLINLIAYLKSQFKNNLLHNQENKYVRKLINQFTQKTANELFSKIKNNSEGFSFLPTDEIIEFIQQQISQFYELKEQQIQEILDLFCPKNSRVAYGIFLEKTFIDYVKKEPVELLNLLFFKNSIEQSIKMEGLPRLFKNSNNSTGKYKNLKEIKKQNKNFLRQFLISDSGSYLYKPISKTSKAIDFALLNTKINNRNQSYEIHLFEVTLRTKKQQLQNKISLFLEAQQLLEQEFNQMDEIQEIKKKCIEDKKQFIFEIYYWVMGDSLNFKNIKSLTLKANEKIKKRENSCLKQLIPLNFSQLDIKRKNQCDYAGNLLCILQEKLKNTTEVQRQ